MARGIDDDEGGDGFHTIFLFQVGCLIDIDGLDRIAVSLEQPRRPCASGGKARTTRRGNRGARARQSVSSMACRWRGRAKGRRVSCRKDSFPSGETAGRREAVSPAGTSLGPHTWFDGMEHVSGWASGREVCGRTVLACPGQA